MNIYRVDTHIHTCLSPCGDWGMGPKDIAERSRRTGLDIIAVCDHNTAENAEAVMRAGSAVGLTVIPGMEICSREEVHVVALFGSLETALRMQETIYAHLPGQNRPAVWGDQIVADDENGVVGENSRLLIGATALDLQAIVEQVHALGGLAIAAHVDRPAFSLIGNLGFVPPDIRFDAMEVSFRVPLSGAREAVAGIGGYPVVTASDAHYIHDIGRAWFEARMAAPTLGELGQAIRGTGGRGIVIH